LVRTFEPFSVRKPELSFDEVVRIFDTVEQFGTRLINLNGGELFLREDSLEIIKVARKKFITQLITNATLLNDEICKTLRKLNVPVMVYAPSFSKESYERLAQIKGSYRRLVSGVRTLIEAHLESVLLIPLSRPLVPDLEKSIVAINHMGGRSVKFTLYPGSGYGAQFLHELALDLHENMQMVFRIESLREKYRTHVRLYHQFVAPYLGNNCGDSYALDAYGNIMPCAYLRLPFGNILKDQLSQVWKRIASEIGTRVGRNARSPLECNGCNVVSPLTGYFCNGGCRCVAHNIYGKLAGPDLGCSYLALRRHIGQDKN